MAGNPSVNLTWGWVSTPNTRGTIDILYGSLTTIYLCTWTSLCLNIPQSGTRRWRLALYKFRWQLFAIFFPEVLVATAAEQWLSARQSVREFAAMGIDEWTTRHGFFADMGGIKVAPPDIGPFPVDAQQLAYLVKHKYLPITAHQHRRHMQHEQGRRARARCHFHSDDLVLSDLYSTGGDAHRALAAGADNAGIYLVRSPHLLLLVLQAAGPWLRAGVEHGHSDLTGASRRWRRGILPTDATRLRQAPTGPKEPDKAILVRLRSRLRFQRRSRAETRPDLGEQQKHPSRRNRLVYDGVFAPVPDHVLRTTSRGGMDHVVPYQHRMVSMDSFELHRIRAHLSVRLSLATGNALCAVHRTKCLQSTSLVNP